MRSILVVLVLSTLVLAGCVGGDDEPVPGEGEDQQPTDDTGSIYGQVARLDFSPITNADILIGQDGALVGEATTDENGDYTYGGLSPGRYQVQISAPCCRSAASTVSVEAGENTQYSVQLRENPPEVDEYVDPNGEWSGLVGCSIGHNLGTINCPDDNDDREHTFTAKVGLKTIVVGMQWTPVFTSNTDELRHWFYIQDAEEGGLQSKVRLNEASPVEYRVDHSTNVQNEFEHDFSAYDEEFEMGFIISAPRASYVDVVYQQEFTIYWHLFYGEPAPDPYSALPDQ